MTKFSNLESINFKSSNIYEDSGMKDLISDLQRFNITDYDVIINGEESMVIFMRRNDVQSSTIFSLE
jgi:hypothetical protein